MVTWRNCKDDAPKYNGVYQVLILSDDHQHWCNVDGRYDVKHNSWELWLDGFGWSGDSGYEPIYWYKLPVFPPVPYNGPICKYFREDSCVAQKNAPRCYCQGNESKCER
jgi:hypothetical protein